MQLRTIAYDFPFNLSESEIGASAYAEDKYAAHEMDHINQQITVIKLKLYTIY